MFIPITAHVPIKAGTISNLITACLLITAHTNLDLITSSHRDFQVAHCRITELYPNSTIPSKMKQTKQMYSIRYTSKWHSYSLLIFYYIRILIADYSFSYSNALFTTVVYSYSHLNTFNSIKINNTFTNNSRIIFVTFKGSQVDRFALCHSLAT